MMTHYDNKLIFMKRFLTTHRDHILSFTPSTFTLVQLNSDIICCVKFSFQVLVVRSLNCKELDKSSKVV